MATPLSNLAQTKTQETRQKPQLVLEIEGVETRFGLGAIKKYIKIGDPGLLIGDDWVIGGLNDQENQLDAISLDGTTTTIAQQLLQDRGGTSSVSGIQVSLLDVDEEITKLITPGEVVDDVLGRRANVYLGYQDTAFPQDFIQIFAGIIDEVNAGPTIIFNIAHPEQKKRGQVLAQVTTELTEDLNFRSEIIQGMLFKTRRDVVGSVTVEYQDTATAGSESIFTSATILIIGIEAGVTTNTQIKKAIENSLAALELVTVEIQDGHDADLIAVQPTTLLDSDLSVPVLETKGFLLPMASEGFRTYVRIDDEVIEYTGIDSVNGLLTGCTRAAFEDKDSRAFGDHHDVETKVESFYRLQGKAIDICLKMMMSGGPEYFVEDVPVKAINEVEGVGNIPNSLYFDGVNVENKYGLVPGDKATVTGDAIPGNNVTDALIAQVVVTDFGSYVLLDGVTLTDQPLSSASVSFKTKWNVWPEGAGLGMGGDEVDVPQFEDLMATFDTAIFTYDFYIRDTLTVKDFLDTEVLYPTGAFTLPRKGKVSAGFTSPPIGGVDLKVFSSSNTIKPEQNRVYRGISRYFYNNIVFRFDENVLDEGKFQKGEVTVDADSLNRIKVGNRTLVIDARGLRPSTDTTTIINQLTQRFLDRYKFAAERIKIQCFYGDAFNADVGDIVAFGGKDLQIPDSRAASRDTRVKLYEIVNKSLNLLSGVVTFDLVDTAFSLTGARFGVVSPASKIGVGSTASQLKLVNSYGNEPPRKERVKWEDFIGQDVMIHEEDEAGEWTYFEIRTLQGFQPSDGNVMFVDPPLPSPPGEGAVVEIIPYPDNADPELGEVYKRQFVYTNPAVAVDSGVDNFSFNVAVADAPLFKEGQPLILHQDDADGLWAAVTPEVKIESVVGTLVTVDADLGVTPDATWTIELIGFPDEGYPYRYL